MWGKRQRGNNAACSALCWFSITSPATHKQIGPFWRWFPGGWVCVPSRTLWVSPTNCPMRLSGSSSHHCNPHRYFQWEALRLYFPALEPWVAARVCVCVCVCVLCLVSQLFLLVYLHANVGPPSLPASASLGPPASAALPWVLFTRCPSPLLLPVWMNISFLTPWLSDFHTVRFSGCSGYFFNFKFVAVLLLVLRGGSLSTYASSWPGVRICF